MGNFISVNGCAPVRLKALPEKSCKAVPGVL